MAIDTMMYQLEDRQNANIFEYVERMRTRRTQMVQNAVSCAHVHLLKTHHPDHSTPPPTSSSMLYPSVSNYIQSFCAQLRVVHIEQHFIERLPAYMIISDLELRRCSKQIHHTNDPSTSPSHQSRHPTLLPPPPTPTPTPHTSHPTPHTPPTLRASTSTSMMPSTTTSTARTPPLWPTS